MRYLIAVLSLIVAACAQQASGQSTAPMIIVAEVAKGSSAEEAGIKPGDRIGTVHLQIVTDAKNATDLIEVLRRDGPEAVTILIYRDGKPRFYVMRLREPVGGLKLVDQKSPG